MTVKANICNGGEHWPLSVTNIVKKSSADAEMAAQCCVCHFLLVNYTNLHLISHRFQIILQYWSNFRFREGAASL